MNARNLSETRARSRFYAARMLVLCVQEAGFKPGFMAGFMLPGPLEYPFYHFCGLQIVWLQENVSPMEIHAW